MSRNGQSVDSVDNKELAAVLHDLRQPLQSISLLNSALMRRADEDATIQMLQLQEESIANMCRLLDELLDGSERGGAAGPERIRDLADG